MRHFPFIPLLLLCCLILAGCKASMAVRKADRYFGYGEYYAAANQYGKAYRLLNNEEKAIKARVAFFRGESFRKLNQPLKAESEYRKALRYNYPGDTLTLHLAQSLQKNGKYDEAITQYQQFLEKYPENTLALNGLYACRQIPLWNETHALYSVKKATGLLTKKGNFSPVYIPAAYNTLLFNSSSKVKKTNQKPSRITGLPDNDFFIATKDIKGNWEKPVWVEAAINSEFDEGAASFSADGSTLYFTRCISKSDSIEMESKVAIFRAIRSGTEWGEPEKLDLYRDSTALFAHPAIKPDNKYLYFVSDIPGGYGGKDIWRCEKSAKAFGPPENLGPAINTPGDEMFPSFRDDTTLYFSSDGLPGFGGLDLFKAVIKPDQPIRVENLMQPINSSADDFGITFNGKKEEGYFSTNRKEGRGWDQIWQFQQAQTLITVTGTVSDRYGDILPEAIIRIISDKGVNTKIRTNKDGAYTFQLEKGGQYVMLGTARSYLNYSNKIDVYNKDKDTVYTADFTLTPLYRPVRIENIFFDFNEATLLPESFKALEELNKLLLDNPHIVVEISAHTDRIGSEDYNLQLSEKRAIAVVTYLTQQGIEADRLVAKGYGKSQPVKVDEALSDKYPFLKKDSYLEEEYIETLTPEQQEIADQINRRSEFKVLKTTYKLF